ncbi:MAG: thioredoxin domain-containing protein [Hyphomonadaceae bacterium]|nr:thioredoxin domain-containing protein [Hyphomonadaceae bacterium]
MNFLRLALAATALLLAACEQPREPEAYKTVEITPFLGQPVMGDPNAPVLITEYASTTCGHCRAFHEQVFPELKAKYIDTGKARLAWVVMPTPPLAISIAGASIARCAGEDKFFAVIDDLFDHQNEIIESSRNPWRLQKSLRDLGGRHGLNADQVGTCIDDDALVELTRKYVQESPPFVTSTPTFIIGGEDVDQTMEALSAAIDAELAKAAPQ